MNTQYWEEEIETMSREKLQELQLQRLKKTINIAANAPYYKEVLASITLLLTIYSPWMISVKFLLLQRQICALTILLG